jgi:electron-transferring-flavoprotein dehydrogenase
VLIVGDAAGFVDVPSLKGIHYAMQTGIYAARAIFEGLKSGDLSADSLSAYDRMVDGSYVASDLHAPATCGSPSRTASSWAAPRRV